MACVSFPFGVPAWAAPPSRAAAGGRLRSRRGPASGEARPEPFGAGAARPLSGSRAATRPSSEVAAAGPRGFSGLGFSGSSVRPSVRQVLGEVLWALLRGLHVGGARVAVRRSPSARRWTREAFAAVLPGRFLPVPPMFCPQRVGELLSLYELLFFLKVIFKNLTYF